MFDATTTTVAERDQELGRWRDPDSRSMVCYSHLYGVTILNEATGRSELWTRGQACTEINHDIFGYQEAIRYFAAHPVSKPWHAAKAGEVWALTTYEEGGEHVWGVDSELFGGRFVYIGGLSNIPFDHPDITEGRRIWPEVSNG